MSKLAGKMQHLVVGGEYVVKAKYKRIKNMAINIHRLPYTPLFHKAEKHSYYF